MSVTGVAIRTKVVIVAVVFGQSIFIQYLTLFFFVRSLAPYLPI